MIKITPPLEIKIKVMLEGSRIGDVVSSSPNNNDFSVFNWYGIIFTCGADEVVYLSAKYKKTSDRAYFDGGAAIRQLTYKITH